MRVAYLDESYRTTSGHYLVAGIVLDAVACHEMRNQVERTKRRGRAPFHWYEECHATRLRFADLAATLASALFVAVAHPVPRARQERARALCHRGLIRAVESPGYPIELVIESRTKALDKRDAGRLVGMRQAGSISSKVDFSFAKKTEPLLWLADATAGSMNTALAGDSTYIDQIGGKLVRLDVGGA